MILAAVALRGFHVLIGALFLAAVVVCLKTLGFRRPNGSPDGFPSGHSALAVYAAVVLAGAWPPVLLVALAVCIQRYVSHAHTWTQIIAGAALGALAASLNAEVVRV